VTPEIDGPNYATIGPGDPIYRTALLAFHDRNRHPARAQALATTLADLWPLSAGERPKVEHRALTAAALADAGLDLGDVTYELADVYGEPQLDTVRRWIKKGRGMQTPGRDFAPFVEQVGTGTQPAALTLAQSWTRPEQAETRAAEHAIRSAVE
jgi:hypothetical protein